MSDEASAYDTPLHRAAITALPIDVLDHMIEDIRIRRLSWVSKLEAAERIKKEAHDDILVAKYTILHKKISSQIAKLDDAIEKIEVNINKLRAMVLELEG